MFNRKQKQDYYKFLQQINYGYSLFNEKNKLELDEFGYTIIKADKNYWSKNDIDFDELENKCNQLSKTEGINGGWENKKKNYLGHAEPSAQRISNLPNKDKIFLQISKLPDFLFAAAQVIKRPFKFNAMQSRFPLPYGKAQSLHIDWRPRLFKYFNYNQITCFIYLDDATMQNGSLHVYPGTHKLCGAPNTEYIEKKNLKVKALEAKKYNIIFLNIYAWHFGGKNINGLPRRTIFSSYRERSEFQQLNQKKFLDSDLIRNMTDFEKYLFAVRECDKTQNEFFKERRDTSLAKSYHILRDIVYHKYLEKFF